MKLLCLLGSLLVLRGSFAQVTVEVNITSSVAPVTSEGSSSTVTTPQATTSVPTTSGQASTSEGASSGPTTSGLITSGPTTSGPVFTTTGSVVSTTAAPTDVLYYVQEKNVTCILMNSSVEITVPYLNTSGKVTHGKVHLPANGNTDKSSCNYTGSSSQQLLAIQFFNDWQLSLVFTQSSSKFALTTIQVDYDSGYFADGRPGDKYKAIYTGTDKAALGQTVATASYFYCDKPVKTSLQSNTSDGSSVQFEHLRVQAFRTTSDFAFPSAKTECNADFGDTSYVVPIVVGVALAVVILIVLIAYIIGRYRARNPYQTV